MKKQAGKLFCNFSTQETEIGGLPWVWGQAGLHNKSWSQTMKNYFFLKFFILRSVFIQCTLFIFFLSSNSSQIFPNSLPTLFMFFFFQKIKTKKTNYQKIKTNCTFQKMGSIFRWPSALGHGICSAAWLIPNATPLKKTRLPFPSRYQSQTAS